MSSTAQRWKLKGLQHLEVKCVGRDKHIPNQREHKTYRGVLQFHTLSSVRSFHNSRLQRRCLRPRYFLWGKNKPESASEMTGVMKHVTHFLCHCFSLLLHWRWTMETQNMLHCNHPPTEKEKKRISGELILLNDTHPIYCSVLLYFLARYLAEALLGILTMDSSLP